MCGLNFCFSVDLSGFIPTSFFLRIIAPMSRPPFPDDRKGRSYAKQRKKDLRNTKERPGSGTLQLPVSELPANANVPRLGQIWKTGVCKAGFTLNPSCRIGPPLRLLPRALRLRDIGVSLKCRQTRCLVISNTAPPMLVLSIGYSDQKRRDQIREIRAVSVNLNVSHETD